MREKYKFNPDSLRYVKVRKSLKERFLHIFTYLSAILIVAVVFNIVYSGIFDTPKEKQLRRENNQLLFHYELMYKRLSHVENVLQEIQQRDDNIYRTIFEAEPIPKSIREAGFGGVNRYKEIENLSNSDIVLETTKKLDKIRKQLYIQSKSFDEIIKLVKNKEKLIASLPSIMPISNKDLTRTASGWGYRIHPIYKIKKFHYGMDFTAPTGTEIYATGDGVIKKLDHSRRGYGNKIIVDHGFGYQTLYAHLSGFNVREGQEVKRGDVIGYVGNSGLSTGPHLHYEVLKNGKRINPINYYFNDLTPEEYD
ncbi:MAG: M23 family metallopeptidase, partial [bacterium]